MAVMTEAEMVRYFDDMLAVGEDNAMHRLADSVRGKGTAP